MKRSQMYKLECEGRRLSWRFDLSRTEKPGIAVSASLSESSDLYCSSYIVTTEIDGPEMENHDLTLFFFDFTLLSARMYSMLFQLISFLT